MPGTGWPTCVTRCGSAKRWPLPVPLTPRSSRSARTRLLTYAISDTLGDTHHHALGTLARDTHDTVSFHTALNTTHTTHPPDTEHPPGPHPQLPTTPGITPATGSPPHAPPRWEHTRCWASA